MIPKPDLGFPVAMVPASSNGDAMDAVTAPSICALPNRWDAITRWTSVGESPERGPVRDSNLSAEYRVPTCLDRSLDPMEMTSTTRAMLSSVHAAIPARPIAARAWIPDGMARILPFPPAFVLVWPLVAKP